MVLLVPTLVSAGAGGAPRRGPPAVAAHGSAGRGAAWLPGGLLAVGGRGGGLFRETVTGPDGLFLMSAMTPGVYEVSAELAGFRKYSARDVRLEVGATAQVELKLEVGGRDRIGHRHRRVAARRHHDAGNRRPHQRPGVRRHAVVQPQLRRLPRHAARRGRDDLGDDLRRRLDQRRRPERPQRQLHDGRVEQQRHVQRRQRRRAGARAGGSGAGVPAADQPVRRRFGLASGGIVNSVSKQGTNQYHGSAFVFFQDEKLATNEYFARKEGLDEAETKQQQCGGTLGGPIIRDKAHFFGSVERVLLDSGVTTNIPTRPDLNRTDFERRGVEHLRPRRSSAHPEQPWGLRWLRETSPQPLQIQARTTRRHGTRPRPTSTGRWSAT